MERGIVIIATRNAIYGKMAYNLALTIKATGTEIPVVVIADTRALSHLNQEQIQRAFNQVIMTEWDWNTVRFNIDKLSPFDHTMLLDADVLWLFRKPDELFDKYQNEELLVTNEGYYDIKKKLDKTTGGYPWLADVPSTVKAYELKGKLFLMRWECVLFRKTDKFRKMLERAEEIRKNPLVFTLKFEGQTVDEYCFYVACCELGLVQKETPFLPIFWKSAYKGTVADMSKNHYGMSFGGNNATHFYRKFYDTIMGATIYKLGIKSFFKLPSKRVYIPERKAI